jgi:hypothetical protein
MKRTGIVATVSIVLGAAAPAIGAAPAAENSRAEVVALAHRVIDAFNKGDLATAKELAPAQSIIDEMPQFAWQGAGATDAWLSDVARDDQRLKITDGASALGPPTYVRVEGDQAYAVFPDHYSYKRDGVRVDERATWTITARKSAGGWRIVAWSFAADAH